MTKPVMEAERVSKVFDERKVLDDVSLSVYPGEVHCLLGDNGAGKSTLIKIMSGVHGLTTGQLRLDDKPVSFSSPRDAQRHSIATVYQDIDTFPLMSVSQVFFLGREITKGHGPLRRVDKRLTGNLALKHFSEMGIRGVTSGDQLVGGLSGGEQQAMAISRAIYFGARILILDEPTSALGVKEAATVLRLMETTKQHGTAIIFITHNAHHALRSGDRFTVLIHGRVADQFRRGERSREELLNLMAGGEKMEELEAELEGPSTWTRDDCG
jgi:simple sugar transport system ATP-binding protein